MGSCFVEGQTTLQIHEEGRIDTVREIFSPNTYQNNIS